VAVKIYLYILIYQAWQSQCDCSNHTLLSAICCYKYCGYIIS